MNRLECGCKRVVRAQYRHYRVGQKSPGAQVENEDVKSASYSPSTSQPTSVWDRIALKQDTSKAGQNENKRPPGKASVTEKYNFSRPGAPLFQSGEAEQKGKGKAEGHFIDDLIEDDFAEHATYRRITAADTVNRREPPTRCKMLVRDFIHDSLYNPHYGYFSKQALIYSADEDSFKVQDSARKSLQHAQMRRLDIRTLKDNSDFLLKIGQRYSQLEGEFDANDGIGKQVWHTPTELFSPHYGRSIANYILEEYRLNLYPYEDLVIYEMGAGNGTLMRDILSCILENGGPNIWARTKYRIVEISPQLARLQRKKADDLISRYVAEGHDQCPKIEIVNQSIFEWKQRIPSPVFIVALEVLDNFAHDVVRFSTETGEAYQGIVASNGDGDFTELYEPVHDPLIERYLALRQEAASFKPSMVEYLNASRPHHELFPRSIFWLMSTWQKIRSILPFAPNLSPPEFLATQQLRFLDILHYYFPAHRLIVSDFDRLPESIDGGGNSGLNILGMTVRSQRNSPVVQTRYQNTMVPCGTYMVQQGWFDIFFPTDFELLRSIYNQLVWSSTSSNNRLGNFFEPDYLNAPSSSLRNRPKIYSHREFLETYSDDQGISETTTKSGENPMLEYYENAKFFVS